MLQHLPKLFKMKNYPVIEVPASGKPDWYEGAYSLFFVYSKNNGNFVLKGYRGEVEKYLKRNYTHYFYYCSMWCKGKSRGNWNFWKDDVLILRPYRSPKLRKLQSKFRVYNRNNQNNPLQLKRMPNRWIPEFDIF